MMRPVSDARATVSLPEAAGMLGVHYMTAYRYIRTGVLPAVRSGSHWRVAVSDLDALARERREPASPKPGGSVPRLADRAARLERRLVVGDEGGAWQLVEQALGSGAAPVSVLLDVIAPAMRLVGDDWEGGRISVADEHRASAVAMRLVGRLGPLARHRGVGRGTVVVGSPPGERHQLPVAIAADVLRARGFDVIDLGCDVPAATWAGPVCEPRVIAVAIGVTGTGQTRAVRAVLRTVAAAAPHLPRFVGGAGLDGPNLASVLGATWSGYDADTLAGAIMNVSP